MRFLRCTLWVRIAPLACCTLLHTGFAATLITGVDESASGVQHFSVNNYHGYEFSLASPVIVTALGWYDFGADGLAGNTPVGFWDLGHNLLASVTVPAGATDPLINGFRMHDLSSPLTVAPGTYILAGGTQGTDQYLLSSTNFSFVSFDPRVTWIQERWKGGNTPGFPVNTTTNFALFGPNAVFGDAPEPGSLQLIALGSLLVIGASILRHSRTRAA